MAEQDYYKRLGVAKDADAARIKSAYRELAFEYHPDRNEGNPEAAGKMKALNEAYAVLSDPKKRHDYDRLHRQYGSSRAYDRFRESYSEQDIFSNTDIRKVFEDLAKSFGFRSFEEISKEFYGRKRNGFEFKSGNVHFKGFFFAGTFNAGHLLSGRKFPGMVGRIARTLLRQTAGTQLSEQARDYSDTIRISPDLARTGGPYAYYHKWRDKKLVVKIPPGIRHGKKIRLSGMGEDRDGSVGDLFLTVETKSSMLDSIRRYLPF